MRYNKKLWMRIFNQHKKYLSMHQQNQETYIKHHKDVHVIYFVATH